VQGAAGQSGRARTRTDRACLVVIDGSKALASAVRDVFGARALIQRCREHKKRNVTDARPRAQRTAMRQLLNHPYATRAVQRIQALLEHTRRASCSVPIRCRGGAA
jgi:transposase-like protein